MKYVTCPPCGTVFEGQTDRDVIEATQAHAKDKHDYAIPYEEIAGAITTAPPPTSGD